MRSRSHSRKAIGDGIEVKRFKVSHLSALHYSSQESEKQGRSSQCWGGGSDALSVSVSSYELHDRWVAGGGKAEP
jgi:hypothetical protein